MKIWSWRHAIQKADLPSTTKLVLFNLSVYMNERGDGCYPTTETQAKDTGLSERAVCKHIKAAEDAGYLIKKKHGFSGQGWSRNEYKASVPKIIKKGTELGSVRKAIKKSKKALTEGKCEGTDPNDKKALTEGQSNTPINSSGVKPLVPLQGSSVDKLKKYDVLLHLKEADLIRAKRNAPGWDIYALVYAYNLGVWDNKREPPRNPSAAFPKWCGKYTKGAPPS